MSRTLSSVAFDSLKDQKLASKEANFSSKAKHTFARDSFSLNFSTNAESVVEVGGTIIVSF